MRSLHRSLSAFLLTAVAAHAAETDRFDEMSLSRLEQQLEDIDTRLAQLAHYSLGSGIGAIGYRSEPHETADHTEWIEIDFGTSIPLDEVVLVPAIRRDTKSGFQADAFPMHFRLLAGQPGDKAGTVIAEYDCEEQVLPRIAPLMISCSGIEASWIRLEADKLSLRAFDDRYVLQLSEIMAFSGEENAALNAEVRSRSGAHSDTPAWHVSYVVDGFLPYLMDAAEGLKSVAYLTPPNLTAKPSLIIDLGEPRPVSRIRLHAVDQSDTIPQAFAGEFGIPEKMLVEGANQADFADARPLLHLHYETIYQIGPIMTHAFEESHCRYVRFGALDLAATTRYGNIPRQMGFAEIEILSRGKNVARGQKCRSNFREISPERPFDHLTDGLNMYGEILPLRAWMNQLATRHDLEVRRPLVVKELNLRYTRQKTSLRRLGWLTGLLLAGSVIIILVDRIIRQRAVHRTRQQIAADLHDELGANLHAIGLLGDLAQSAKDTPEKLGRLLQRMRALTERTGAAARYCTNMLEARGLYGDLVEDMRKSAARITADLDHDIRFEGEKALQRLKPRKRLDLFLFYKECLINIIRHSGATQVKTRLIADQSTLTLTVIDNGHGLNSGIPPSLKRRARLLGGSVTAERQDGGGTRIILGLKHKKAGIIP
jgi:signal transduction histidine kinase